MAVKHKHNSFKSELNDIVRGACGGFLFGIPLLYTMEVWWVGSLVKAQLMMSAIALMFVVVFLLNKTEGFRKIQRRKRPYESITDTIEAIAIGIICSALMLILLREITIATSLKEAIGKIIFESVPFTFGVALANQFLGESNNNQESSHNNHQKPSNLNATFADLGATLIGATVIAFNIAPTDEVTMIVAAVSAPWLLAIMAASLVISYAIVFQAGFSDQQKRKQQKGIFQRPLSETVISYLVSLIASAFMLWFFHKLSFSNPWSMWLENTLILGLPATIGGAAGRLAI
ncbi:TIGR02587 family membrane protein [Nostoc sp. CMAA1605]|uniref:TIGR02587 family membrane protein n=1 Tax=Nostoc sp. CMAA1605 TaxID=2055159 RepID=UPI001F35825F|nr:TIGR02587 family membrane protein [Nostoc sp. CMAA1605]MCF4966460.1 TIGR02587 family membrane protein [Nostoc sp. CMAA1605]